MTNFIEIKNTLNATVLINVNNISCIDQSGGYTFIWLKNGRSVWTYETIEEIKAKL